MHTLDLEKLKKLEKKYQNDRISLYALENMVIEITKTYDTGSPTSGIAFNTLKELDILVEKDKKIEQLNS
jgi:hypothetical protein